MKKINHVACIEVCVRDTQAGKISWNGKKLKITKKLNQEDRKRRDLGLEAIANIFYSQQALSMQVGAFPIGLHLMGGCSLGTDSKNSVTNPEFKLHEHKNIFVSDSSLFPNAPGINPSFTIMALAKKAATEIIRG